MCPISLEFSDQFRYKDFTFGFLIDSRVGGKFLLTNLQSGHDSVFAETAANGIRETGVVIDGVTGDVTFNPDGSIHSVQHSAKH